MHTADRLHADADECNSDLQSICAFVTMRRLWWQPGTLEYSDNPDMPTSAISLIFAPLFFTVQQASVQSFISQVVVFPADMDPNVSAGKDSRRPFNPRGTSHVPRKSTPIIIIVESGPNSA